MVVVGLLSLIGTGGEDDEAGSAAETFVEDVAGVAVLGEEVDVASCNIETS